MKLATLCYVKAGGKTLQGNRVKIGVRLSLVNKRGD